MSLRIKPYIFAGWGGFLRPLTYEFNDQRQLIISGPVSGTIASIPLEGASAEREDHTKWRITRLFRRMANIGDVRITTPSTNRLCTRIPNVEEFIRAVEGTHSTVVSEMEKKRKENALNEKLANLRDEDLADIVVCYPHIPKAAVRLLQGLDPDTYLNAHYIPVLRVGQAVKPGDVIARYGKIEITSPLYGRIEMIGSSEPGKYEWPEPQDRISREDVSEKELQELNLNLRKLVFDADNEKDCYSFAIRPFADCEEQPLGTSYPVCEAFDGGKARRKENEDPPMSCANGNTPTFFTLIDLTVYDLKSPGSGYALPPHLMNDEDFKQELHRYWPLINLGAARLKRIENGNKPKPPHLGDHNP